MTSKTITTLAFAAGCVLALGAMPPAHAQTTEGLNRTLATQPPYAGAYIGQQPGDQGVGMAWQRPYPAQQPYAVPQLPPGTYSGSTAPPQAYAGTQPNAGATVPPQPMAAPPQLATNGPVASRGDYGEWSARRNNIESARYDRLLETNMAFREHRKRMECGPISDAKLQAQCLASFQQYEPVMVGSSMPPRLHHRYYRHHRRYHRGAGY